MTRPYHELDIHRLEEEWVGQVALYREHAEQLAEASRKLAEAETELEVRKAELKETAARQDLAVRKSPELFGLTKPTEGAIEKTVLLSADYLRARDAVFAAMRIVDQAKYARDMAKAAESTVGYQRKAAIQDLVQLWHSSYFASPRLPKDSGGSEMERAEHQTAFGGRPRRASE